MSRNLIFTLRAFGDLVEITGDGRHPTTMTRWVAKRGPVLFDMVSESGVAPKGWVLLEGQLVRRGSDFTAKLYYDLGDGFKEEQSIALPISRKGTIHELIRLPRGIKALRWHAMNSGGEVEQSPLRMTKVGWFERTARMKSGAWSRRFSCTRGPGARRSA